MNQEEKIYQKIREASHKTEETSFPGMDKVWNRVEEKLDTKIIKKKSEVWKKLAIAASFLLFFTVGIQLFTTQKELNEPIVPKVNMESSSENNANLDTIKTEEFTNDKSAVESFLNTDGTKNKVAAPTNPSEEIVSEAKSTAIYDDIPAMGYSNKKIAESAKTSFDAEEITADVEIISHKELLEKGHFNSASSNNVFYPGKGKIYATRSSNMKYELQDTTEKESKVQSKNDDLLIINGELSSKKRKDLNPNEIEEMVELKNPIYIINGEEFSEESLFGEKPTSKYAPLTNQKIDSIKVYLPEEAIPIYGAKGKNGVVIIAIKK
jgi:hypothetical protein